MIARDIHKKLVEISTYYPITTITGPRQSGKTTLIKSVFSDLPYVLLEAPDIKNRVLEDPRGFLDRYPNGAIFDEIQNTPELFSYLQGIVDENKDIKFILSGSQNFLLLENISQTLAGRTAILKLLPLSLAELKKTKYKIKNSLDYIFKGSYPRLYNNSIPPDIFYSDYIQTYVERDVRTIKNIGDLDTFRRFVQLCAGRIGQILNMNSLASDTGITINTAKSWISILEASYIVHLLQPHHKNFNKRLVKSPKMYFYDTGLACNLLRIKSAVQLDLHHLRGNLFENFIVNELLKSKFNNAEPSNLYYWRDKHGKEIDCLIETANKLIPIEIKSSKTYTKEYFKHLIYWNKLSGSDKKDNYLIYNGDENDKLPNGNLISWNSLEKIPLE
ncbi:ATP-binding protein [Aureibaculum sp. 2210JD6-5]|uniref:ATP-binding protein n=1 Tax=Aureibaculum sp. 2210JD6-5 TaxID=3103957 RepID=UPI002AACBDF3|nr:ATP-binding protein [Aureibaculum sp. 2210JD6-5]MDY7396851.1 ATP-binding protein [Aureibaculum sp. 2210JD6-5]